MKYKFIPIAALLLASAVSVSAQSVQDQMLDTFIKLVKIDSQSSNDSTLTFGQKVMQKVLVDEIKSIPGIDKNGISVTSTDDCYVYVTIPSNVKNDCPTLGISCHIDITPEAPGGVITPIIDTKDGHTIVKSDGTTLLGADDKCGVTISLQMIKTLAADKKIKHGEIQFAFCPNEEVAGAADNIDVNRFNPDILYDLDGGGGEIVTKSNFTARGVVVKFIGKDVHPAEAKAEGLGDATAAAATFIAYFPVAVRPESTEGLEGYIHPWGFFKDGADVTVQTRIRYFDQNEGVKFDGLLKEALEKAASDFPNVKVEVVQDGLQYENVAYTLHPAAKTLIENAAIKIGKKIIFVDERGGTTASMFAAKGLKGGMCVFSGQHDIHSTREWADFQEMEDAYRLMMEIVKDIPRLK